MKEVDVRFDVSTQQSRSCELGGVEDASSVLSDRRLKVMHALGLGFSHQEIADSMGLSLRIVRRDIFTSRRLLRGVLR